MDSTAVATGVAQILNHYLPGLDSRTHLLLVGVVASLVLSLARKIANAWSGYDDKLIGAIKPWWEKWAGILNPVIAAILGYLLDGGGLAGLLAGAAGRGIVVAAKSVTTTSVTAVGLKKARLGILVLGVLLAAPVAAKPPGVLERAVARTAFSFGPEVRFREGQKPDVALKIQPALIWGNHLALRPWASRSILKESGNKWESGAYLAVVF